MSLEPSDMIAELLDIKDQLTDWELGFTFSMLEVMHLSDKQIEIIKSLHSRYTDESRYRGFEK